MQSGSPELKTYRTLMLRAAQTKAEQPGVYLPKTVVQVLLPTKERICGGDLAPARNYDATA